MASSRAQRLQVVQLACRSVPVGLLGLRGALSTVLVLGCAWLLSAPVSAATSSDRGTAVAAHARAAPARGHSARLKRARSCHAAKVSKHGRAVKVAERRGRASHSKRNCERSTKKSSSGSSSAPAPSAAAPASKTGKGGGSRPGGGSSSSPAKHSPVPAPPEGEAPPIEATPRGSSDPFANERFYVEPNSAAARTQQEWSKAGRSGEAAEIAKIATQASAEWFGDWSYGHGSTAGDVNWWVSAATAAGTLPVLVAYDIPWRDCSQDSAGGASDASAYRQFINGMAEGIAARKAVVILEPDALAELTCLSAAQQSTYYSLLSYAVAHLSESPAVSVYLDAGNAGWQPASTMAARLRKADVAGARGFSLNVSNFDTTASESAYGEAIDHELGDTAHFIIDTSRNGQGSAAGGAWCNPPGRGLGTPPTSATGNPLIDAFFWVKRPGESDGTCNGGPSAGTWWPEYALELAQNAVG
jgi:endoglucanase